MPVIRISYSTMGQSTPASVAEGTKYYTYKGDKPLRRAAPSDPLPQNATATAAKQERFAEYTRRRLAGETKEQAGQAVGICKSTTHDYERQFQDQQQGESRDAG